MNQATELAIHAIFGEAVAPDGTLARENFARWFMESKVVDVDQKPMIVYHGTRADFAAPKMNDTGLFFVTADLISVSEHADGRNGSRVMPLYASIKNPFDNTNKKVLALLVDAGRNAGWLKGDVATLTYPNGPQEISLSLLKSGDYVALESKEVIASIKQLGFDGLRLLERGQTNYAVFSPEQIKSATGNNGLFDPMCPDLTDASSEKLRASQTAKKAATFLLSVDVERKPTKTPKKR